ncbi:MAG: phospholipase D family protein, partial [Alcaligenaceae bacterium]|nr:phospholipase D family protein [Alcaligenaceae bacterium]
MLRKGLLIAIGLLLSACQPPSLEDRQPSQALSRQESADTLLGRVLAPQVEQHPGLSGVVALPNSLDAFAARMLSIEAAQRSIDLQYYIWRDDITGNLLLKALHQAAQRGVRVRLLLDDNGTSGLDGKLALLNSRPNAEVRLFNPFPFRTLKPLGFLTDFRRLNRRMHNKSFTVDGQVTIVGGRNIGDEYFDATPGITFTDLDVMVAGPAVDEVSEDFDRYWNSESAYPLEQLVALPRKRLAKALQEKEASTALTPKALAYARAVAQSTFMENLVARKLEYQWVPVRMVSDDPGKVLGKAQPETMLTARLLETLDAPQQTIDLISPYFVPTTQGVEAFGAWAQQGVRVRILTNGMEATDVIAVHAGYSKYRLPLLKQGVALYEMRRDPDPDRPKEKAGPFGSSGSSLHAKTFAVDGKRLFVGSFNFDPRSINLNTELGFIIESPEMAQALSKSFEEV